MLNNLYKIRQNLYQIEIIFTIILFLFLFYFRDSKNRMFLIGSDNFSTQKLLQLYKILNPKLNYLNLNYIKINNKKFSVDFFS